MQHFVDAKILLFPPGRIPRKVGNGIVVSDTFSSMTGSGVSSGGGSVPQNFVNPTVTGQPWGQNPYTLSIDGAEFIRFFADGRVMYGSSIPRKAAVELAGFFLTPRYAPLDSQIGANAGQQDSGKTDINWTGTQGTWQTLKALDSDSGTGISNIGNDTSVVARTTGTLPQNRAFRLRMQLGALPDQTKLPAVRIVWGGQWALYLLHGKVARVERYVSKTTIVNQLPQTTHEWQLVREMTGTKPINTRGGKYQIEVVRVAGRLIVSLNGTAFWHLDPGDDPTGKDKDRGPQEVVWPESSLFVGADGVRFTRFDLATIKWSAPDGTPYGGSVTRLIPFRTAIGDSSGVIASCGGWKLAGCKAGVTAGLSGGGLQYQLGMTANKDGIDTPFVDKVGARFDHSWVNPTPAPIDVRFAARQIGISLDMNGEVAGSEATIELDRVMLDRFLPGWEKYAQMDNPVEIHLKRAGSSYSKVFSGYLFKPERTSTESGSRTLKLTCRDPLLRLQKVGDVFNAIVDHRYMALDLLFAEQLSGAFSNNGYSSDGTPTAGYKGLYYAQAVQVLLGIALSDEEAALLNGNGDPLRYLSRDHPPIMSADKDIGGWLQLAAISGEPIAAGGWILPPPYRQDVLSWIKQISDTDRCVFFYGWPPGGETDRPVPIYGRLPQILKAQGLRIHVLRDSVFANGSQERLLSSVSVERRPERTFNRVVVIGPQEPGLEGISPSLRIAEYNLDSGENEAAWRSWEKTILVETPLAFLAAEAIGKGVVQQMEGVDLQWPTFDIELDERIGVGHLVRPSLTGPLADTGLGINGRTFRAESVSHQITFTESSGTGTTSIRPRPLSAVEDRAYQHLVNIGGVSENDQGEVPGDVLTP